VLEGALILIGRLLPARRKGPKAPPKPVCGCGHHFSFHDREARACGYASRPVVRSTSAITEYGDAMRCPCRNYAGPEPMPSYYAPEIAGEAGQ
jgi:hypothetical protein